LKKILEKFLIGYSDIFIEKGSVFLKGIPVYVTMKKKKSEVYYE